MSSGRRTASVGAAAAMWLAVAAVAQSSTITHLVPFPETTIAANVTTPSGGPTTPYPITAEIPQLDPAVATLNQVTFEYVFDFQLVIHIPEFGGGSGGAGVGGNFLIGGAIFGGAGSGTGFGGGGPAVFTMDFKAPYLDPVGVYVLTADSNPPAFSQFAGTGTTTFLWDNQYSATWDGSPGGYVDLFLKGSSYVRVVYDYTPVCSTPFADIDKDHDVDMSDFAEWQRCFTGATGPMPATDICYCLNHNQDSVVDAADLEDFMSCWSGPAVLANENCGAL